MKIQYLVNWSFTYQCRMSSFTRTLSLPSSSASLSCAVALNNIQRGGDTQNAPKLYHFQIKNQKIFGTAPSPDLPQWGGGHPLLTPYPLGASARAFGARIPQL